MFVSVGQYDWFSGQLLYCLVRYVKPHRILEISTGSGYSTAFMALALKENGNGMIDTYELDKKTAASAAGFFERMGLDRHIHLSIGDAKKLSEAGRNDYQIYFLDSLHTEAFARWFIETHVMKALDMGALFHMHDIMPRNARVRAWGAPPVEGTPLDTNRQLSLRRRMKKKILEYLHGPEDTGLIPIHVYPPEKEGELATYDGNHTSETVFGHALVASMKQEDFVFLHDMADDYPLLSPRRYDSTVNGRADREGRPLEWNESLWCTIASLQESYRQMKTSLTGGAKG